MPLLVRVLALAVVCVSLPAADLDKFAPADAGAAVVVNIKSLVDSALFKKYVEPQVRDALKGEQVAKFLKAAEFDPLQDLTSVTVAAPLILAPNEAKACILLKGKFHARFQVAALAAAKAQGDRVKITTKGERTFFTVSLAGQTIVATFVGFDTIALASSADYLDAVLNGKVEATQDGKTLRAAFAHLDGRQTLLAGLASGDAVKKALTQDPTTKPYAQTLESVTLAVISTDALDLALVANLTDAEAARTLAQFVRASLPILRLMAAQNEQVKPLVDLLAKNLKVAAEGRAVSLRLQVAEEQLLRLWPGGAEPATRKKIEP